MDADQTGVEANEGVKYLSPSSIGTLTTCSEQYRLERLTDAPQREQWASVGGTVVHLVTEELDRQRFAQTGT